MSDNKGMNIVVKGGEEQRRGEERKGTWWREEWKEVMRWEGGSRGDWWWRVALGKKEWRKMVGMKCGEKWWTKVVREEVRVQETCE